MFLILFTPFPAYELWFKQILFELDSVRDIFISGHVSHIFGVKEFNVFMATPNRVQKLKLF